MKKIELSMWSSDDMDDNISKINDVINQTAGFQNKHHDITEEKFVQLFKNIKTVLSYWTGCTYVGCPKDKNLEKVFNRFFISLYNLILFIEKEERIPEYIRMEIHKTLYRGKLYRYLGYSSEEYAYLKNKQQYVEPVYNDVYVSWSKNLKNSYIESKLIGPITKIECEIIKPFYGIDLEIFGVSRGNEAEVVFPTIKSTVTNIEYIKR